MSMQQRDAETEARAKSDLEEFCALVVLDASLQRMLQLEQAGEFAAAVVELGRQRGFEFEAADVRAAMSVNRQALTANWIEN